MKLLLIFYNLRRFFSEKMQTPQLKELLLQSFRIQWLTVVLLLVLSICPLAQAKPKAKVNVNFTPAQQARTVYVKASAQGALPPAVLFNISIWYNAVGTNGFVTIFSGTLLVQSAHGYASTLVQATIPNGGTDKNGHYFVLVQAYDPATGNLLGKAGYDPRAGGTNGSAG